MNERKAVMQVFDDDIKRKECSFCHQYKPLEQFSDNKYNKDGKYHYCKTCQRPYQNTRKNNRKRQG